MNRQQLRAPGQLSWLGHALTTQRNNITQLMGRLMDIGARAGSSLALHRKFMHLLDAIAIDQKKELEILNDIEEVEKMHAEMRDRKLLRQAAANDDEKPKPKASLKLELPQEKPARSGLLKWIILFALFSQRPVNNKNQ